MKYSVYSRSARWWNGKKWVTTMEALSLPKNGQLSSERVFKTQKAALAAITCEDLDIRITNQG